MKTKLANGIEIPSLGYGVYRVPTKGVTKDCVLKALKAGYRHIDTAQAYQNEEEVGQAIKESGLKREEVFITTKIWISNFGEQKTYDSFMESLKKLDMPYVDLILLHQCYNDVYGSWRALERIYKEGKAKAIGVSNFWPNRLVDLCLHCEVKPMINQIEINPFDQKVEWRKWNDKYGVINEAWGPFAEGKNDIFNNPILTKIAKAHNTGVANVIIRYLLDLKIVVLFTRFINLHPVFSNSFAYLTVLSPVPTKTGLYPDLLILSIKSTAVKNGISFGGFFVKTHKAIYLLP